ncbi:dephospho-CoA kinase [Pelagibacteraceae bacterium]|jgi:dephospho-CoA kinase|nr:dephospho-CoA kinase [Pelagibacteraceae bacterium]
MIKIGLTGSISSGKTTAINIISKNRRLIFSADKVVKKLYSNTIFKSRIAKKFGFKRNTDFKKKLKDQILKKKINLKKLEKIIHPAVRREMIIFSKKNKNKKILFYEIPLLVENKLNNYFDVVIVLKAKKNLRLKRYKSKGGITKLFTLLNSRQLSDSKKMKFCNHIVVNNRSLSFLKAQLLNIINLYE